MNVRSSSLFSNTTAAFTQYDLASPQKVVWLRKYSDIGVNPEHIT